MPHLESILVHPIKSLDAAAVDAAKIGENGGLEWDRRYAIVDENGGYVNGKREQRIHRLRAEFDLERETIAIRDDGSSGASPRERELSARTFHLELDRRALESYLTEFFEYPVTLVREEEGGFPDDTAAAGPTVISRGTLEAVADWFDGIDPTEMRRRLRPNLVVDGPAFWEDRLYDEPGRVVPFGTDATTLHGVNPCQRCVVPTRDPDTGEVTPDFRERFVDRREATLPEWAGDAWFDHYFRLMVNTRVPESSWGERLETGDRLTVGDPMADPSG
ncbi:MOSC domain-containing protein [Natrononativus amylolyticus]|uniref:MOSC domain-containing protein n=1 Tax=Natrononativus amylolyticus TaxID=2963434 RepID=UPI0020CC0B3F|nr:MOSC N-terminal beta barrel domain-containing protein [Natrononativus amylolyticus]